MEFRRVLVPVSGDSSDEQIVRLACSLVKKAKGRVYLVHVVEVAWNLPVESPEPAQVEFGEALLRRLEAIAKEEKCPIESDLLQAREAGPAIVTEAQQRQADLVILGLEYKLRHGEFSLGETAPHVLKHAPCRVWLSREPIPGGEQGP